MNIENFIATGNVHINVHDRIYFMSYEGGVHSPGNNNSEGAAKVLDISGLTFVHRGDANEIPISLGTECIPSLKPFNPIIPVALGAIQR